MIIIKLITHWWRGVLSFGWLVLCSRIDWKELKRNLRGPEADLAIEKIVEKWEDRPWDFFSDIEEQSWLKIVPLLSDENIRRLRIDEFNLNDSACSSFVEHLAKIPNQAVLPHAFRTAVYDFLTRESDLYNANIQSFGNFNEKTNQVIKSIPSSWMKSHGRLFMQALTRSRPLRLRELNEKALSRLLNNSNEACHLITLDILSYLNPTELKLISPKCMNSIIGVGLMDLSSLMQHLRMDIFVFYNGPLTMKTIKSLSSQNVGYYGFLVNKDEKICTALELHYLKNTVAREISARCLYGYLSSKRWEEGLGEIWKSIEMSKLVEFDDEMQLSWVNIHLKDYDLMPPLTQRLILSNALVCSTLGGISFWTPERMQYISAQCLHQILEKGEKPVNLRYLWANVKESVVNNFTEEMKSSWINIHPRDYDWMRFDVRKVILSLPEVCTALGTQFWTSKNVNYITPQCLYQILEKEDTPVKLGALWEHIPCYVLEGFTDEMKQSFTRIHPDDYDWMQLYIQQTILSVPEVCSSLGGSFWTRERIRYISAQCLYQMLRESSQPIELGELWGLIPSLAINNFKGQMLSEIKKITTADFQNMPWSLLVHIFTSDLGIANLPKPSEEIYIFAKAKNLSVCPQRFAIILRVEPNIAGQLLLHSGRLPSNILAYCNGDEILSLKYTIPRHKKLGWKPLFIKLYERYLSSKREDEFGLIVRAISTKANNHFCTKITSFQEYLSLPWLRRHLDDPCRLALPFDSSDIFLLLKAPELTTQVVPWWEMLEKYTFEDWSTISASEQFASILGDYCEFWAAIENEHPTLIRVLNRVMLERIAPDCILTLGNTFQSNVNLIASLSNDAFSKHRRGQLPCKLKDLSPEQISKLSKRTLLDVWCPTSREILEHVLSNIKPGEFKSLNFRQFKSIYESQWAFVPGNIKNEVLEWYLWEVKSQLANFATKVKSSSSFDGARRKEEDDDPDNLSVLKDIFDLILTAFTGEFLKVIHKDLLLISPFVKNSNLYDDFKVIFEKSPFKDSATLSMVRNSEELRDCLLGTTCEKGSSLETIVLPYNAESGFDRVCIIKMLQKYPESFANRNFYMVSEVFVDNGGPLRMLTSQLIADIERDLLTPETTIYKPQPGSLDTMDVESDYFGADFEKKININAMQFDQAKPSHQVVKDNLKEMEVDQSGAISTKTSDAKFVWGISKDIGLIVGLVFGKALQLDIRLSFVLDPAFYYLLVDMDDGLIEAYYRQTYRKEISEFQEYIRSFSNPEQLLDILTEPRNLCFTTLSTKASVEEAKSNLETKTNLWACRENECFQSALELKDAYFPEMYLQDVLSRVLAEFQGFVRELEKGFRVVMPLSKGFTGLPPSVLRPLAKFLPELLNAEPISGEDVLDRVRFNEDYAVECFIPKQLLSVSEIFSAFILSLDEFQLVHLINIWTGTSTLSLRYVELEVIFLLSDNMESYKVNFYEPISQLEAKKSNHIITPGKEYRRFFKKFTQILFGPDIRIDPNSNPDGVAIIPIRVATCNGSLMIYLQSAEQMLNSLVDLLYTSKMTILDQ